MIYVIAYKYNGKQMVCNYTSYISALNALHRYQELYGLLNVTLHIKKGKD